MKFVDEFAQGVGLAPDTLKTGIVLFGNFPLCYVYNRLPGSYKDVFSILISCLSFTILFEPAGLAQIIGLALLCYVLVRYLRFYSWGAIVIFLVAMTTLSANHLHRQILLDEDAPMDHTAPMMVLVMKLTSFAWSCYDGLRPTDELSEYQRKHKIIEFPGLVTFLGYVFYFPTFLIGPTFQYNDYNDFILDKPPFKDAPTGSGPALFTLLMALLPLGINLTLMQNYGYIHTLRRGFMKKTFLVKLWYMYLAGFVHRCTFYAGWKLTEAAAIWTGLGYMGKDAFGINRWYRIQNVNLRQIEFAGNLRLVLEGWNMNTAEWLRQCVYFRVHPRGSKASKSLATFATFVVSAIWHGFYPGYYFAFTTLSMFTIVSRLCRRHLRPLFLTRLSKIRVLYDIFGWFTTQMIAAYIMSSFFVRTLDHSMHAYSQMYYFGHVAIAGTWVFFQIPGVTRVLKAIADTGETFQTVVDGESEEKAALLKDSSTDSLPASADVSESRKDE